MSKFNGHYNIDAWHSSINFSAKHAMVSKVRGSFTVFKGEATLDNNDGRLDFEIEVNSIDTKNIERDEHLLSEDFFAVQKFPLITFASDEIIVISEDTISVQGYLTSKETTLPVNFDLIFTGNVVDSFDNHRFGFEGQLNISRKEYGLTWNSPLANGGLLVSDEIRIELDLSVIKDI